MRKGQRRQWSSSAHCFLETLRSEGVVHGLWRGVGPTMSRAALLSAGQLSSYDHSKTLLLRGGWLEHLTKLRLRDDAEYDRELEMVRGAGSQKTPSHHDCPQPSTLELLVWAEAQTEACYSP